MVILSSVFGFFGCQKSAKHELSEITSVSISCGHTDRRFGYSFWVHKEENGWFLNAECFTNDKETETVFENRELSGDDTETLIGILERNDSILYVENYREPKTFAFQVADGETYGFCLTFSDGSRYVTGDRQKDLEEFFYRIAEKYGI